MSYGGDDRDHDGDGGAHDGDLNGDGRDHDGDDLRMWAIYRRAAAAA